jgi:uncharacterized membrane protein
MSGMSWLRRNFLAGFFVAVPLVVSAAAFLWIFGIVDDLTTPLYQRLLGRRIPGLGILTTAAAILLVGTIATNVIGRRVLKRTEDYLLMVPVFRTIYAPVKQIVLAFSPDNEFGFKRVVLVETDRGYAMGFLTKEFTIDKGNGPQPVVAVYVPTNHLYLGDVIVCDRERALFPEITVEEGIRIFLTGGMATPSHVQRRSDEPPRVPGIMQTFV